jgi:tRNA (guanosine-2'-O-)-methyltransferase
MNDEQSQRDNRPITPRRLNRMRTVLERRQPDLTVVTENVHDPHNISAVLRSCDAVGISKVHLVYTIEERPELSKDVAASAQKWLEVVQHASIAACYNSLRQDGFSIYATALREEAVDLHDLDLTQPVALVFGNEQRGCTEEAVSLADAPVMIPMMGMVQSLNISVACAVTLYEALRQRRVAGAYDVPKLPEQVRTDTLEFWLRRDRRAPLSEQ